MDLFSPPTAKELRERKAARIAACPNHNWVKMVDLTDFSTIIMCKDCYITTGDRGQWYERGLPFEFRNPQSV